VCMHCVLVCAYMCFIAVVADVIAIIIEAVGAHVLACVLVLVLMRVIVIVIVLVVTDCVCVCVYGHPGSQAKCCGQAGLAPQHGPHWAGALLPPHSCRSCSPVCKSEVMVSSCLHRNQARKGATSFTPVALPSPP